MAWKKRESGPIIFWRKNHGLISETFTKYESKVLLRN
ncbi:uncharacterized protein G2W53_022217 [Senna tora]|uniref:Uncharacterized protein n=1 Tax=Senna tora TaxID=362788 RepID=A0A834WK99_9FABA|nr:uncharacterized protein G2W53_022217 [Senna tora]